jgi:pimeloyl-ACP methyl ester carboxylesterase
MVRGTGRSLESDGGRRLVKGLLIAGAAVGVPALALTLLRRRVEAPQAPRWGRTHHYAGRLGEICFQELGRGRPVVLLHSFGPGYDSGQWRAAAEVLAANHRVFALDLPGWGRSEGPIGGHDPGLYVDTLDDFLTGVVGEPAVLVAAGLSAAYAVELAREEPGLVRALALVGPQGLADSGEGARRAFLGRLLHVPLVSAAVLDLLTGRSALEQHLRREVYAAPERVDAALLEHHYRASHVPRSRRALAAYLRGDLALDVAEALPQLTVPVWLAWGRKAQNPPIEAADLWLHDLPEEADADLEVFEGAGNLPHAESPALFCRALERFVASLPEA